jgi:septal ring factor EnvC (AmiA/AmiB activator)
MTQEDLNQIRAVMREEVRGIVREEVRAIVREETSVLREEFAEKLGAAAVSFGTDLSQLREEMIHRMDALDHRMDALESRMERIAETTASISAEVAALNRWANRIDRQNLETLNTLAAQPRAIDDLAKRLRPPNQPPS